MYDGTATHNLGGKQHTSENWKSASEAVQGAARELILLLYDRTIIYEGDTIDILAGGYVIQTLIVRTSDR